MELPPGLVEILKQNKVKSKTPTKKERPHRDDSPTRELAVSKFKTRVVPKFNRNATFRLYSQRLKVYLSGKYKFNEQRKISFGILNRFFPRFDGMETRKKHTHYEDDIIWVYQFADSIAKRERLYRFNLAEINAIDDLDWGDDIESSESSSGSWGNSDFELPSFATFLARTTATSITYDHTNNDNEHWHLEMDVDRKKKRFALKRVTFTLIKK